MAALAVLGQEAASRLVGIGRLQQLDVADPRRQDRVLEAELLGLRTMVHLEAEEAGEPFDRRVQVSHDDGQLYDVAQHGAPPWDGRARSYSRITSLDTSWPDQFPARRGSSTAGPSSRSRSSRWADRKSTRMNSSH